MQAAARACACSTCNNSSMDNEAQQFEALSSNTSGTDAGQLCSSRPPHGRGAAARPSMTATAGRQGIVRAQHRSLRMHWALALVLLLALAFASPGAHAACNETEGREVNSACLAGLVRDVMHVVQTNASM